LVSFPLIPLLVIEFPEKPSSLFNSKILNNCDSESLSLLSKYSNNFCF
jgi:hypothetical protein